MNRRKTHEAIACGGFWIGIWTGGVIGAGLAMVFAPRLAWEFRERISTVADLGDAAARGYQLHRVRSDGTEKARAASRRPTKARLPVPH
jgi:gas vesicle protein